MRGQDENELLEAFNTKKISQQDVDLAYQTLEKLQNKYVDNFDNLVKITNNLCNFDE